jgi:error-prone DNA polymerase
MGFYSPSQLIQDAKRHGIKVLPVDVQQSRWEHRLVSGWENANGQPALQIGLRLVKGLSEEVGLRIEAATPFRDATDLARRARLNDQNLRFLARAGALKRLLGHRYQAHWEVAGVVEPLAIEESIEESTEKAIETEIADGDRSYGVVKENLVAGHEVALPGPTAADNMMDDYRYLSLTLGPHPMQLLRNHPFLTGHRTALDLDGYRQGRFVKMAGLVTGRQRPGTATGVLFVTLEDETGNINVIVWSSVLERFRAALLQGQLLRIKGVVEREKEVIHVVAGHVEDATWLLNELAEGADPAAPFKSRDFR